MKTIFVDSSVLFSAVNSPTGGSPKIFTLKGIKLVTSNVVLTEAEKNVREKLHEYHLDRFFMLVDKIEILNQLPNDKLIKKAEKAITHKDSIILAESKTSKAHFLVTLDKKHFLTKSVEEFLMPQKTLTPKMLIKLIEKK